jgi:hypothetical protein
MSGSSAAKEVAREKFMAKRRRICRSEFPAVLRIQPFTQIKKPQLQAAA